LGGCEDCVAGEVVGGGENFRFVSVEVDSEGGTEGLEAADVPWEIVVGGERKVSSM
jgi:hypothetical protein